MVDTTKHKQPSKWCPLGVVASCLFNVKNVALSTSISGMSYEQVFDSPACARAALGGLFVLSCVHHFVLLYVFTSLVLCCDVRYDFLIKTMFGTSFLPFVCNARNGCG
jgi:hypothetical protein